MTTLTLDDARWRTLSGGYRIAYDASVPLRALAQGADPEPVWATLWDELHHQGDVGEASYAAVAALVPICRARKLVDSNLFGLVATIEMCREVGDNPPIPAWLEQDYEAALNSLYATGLAVLHNGVDRDLLREVLSFIAWRQGAADLGRILSHYDADEIAAVHDELFGE